MTNKIELAEFVPPTEDEERERMAEVAAVREMQKQPSAAADRATNPEEDFMRGLTDDQRERMPRLQARAKLMADRGDLDGVARIKKMFDSEYTKTAARADGSLWDYTRVTRWTIDDAVAQIVEPTEDGKVPSLAEQERRFRDCAERRMNKDGEPYGPPKMTDSNAEVWLKSRDWYNKLEFMVYHGGCLSWRNDPDDEKRMRLDLPDWREGLAGRQPGASPAGEAALLNRTVSEDDINRITVDLRLAFGIEIQQWNTQKTIDTLHRLKAGNAVDPLLERIKVLDWDGKIRIPEMISNHDHTEYSRAWCEMFVYGLIDRLLNPGEKSDLVFVLQGGQGLWKTSFFKAVTAGILFTPTFAALPTDNKDELMRTQGGAVALLDEIDKLVENSKYGGSHVGQLKNFVSEYIDEFRAPYARTVGKHPRRYVLTGTTNSTNWISDLDGYRRWAVLPIEKPIPKELRPNGDRSYWDQLLAEAYYRYTEEGYRGPEYEDFVALAEGTTLEQLDDPVYDSILDWLERPAADRTMMTTSATANGVAAHNDVVDISCLDIRLIRDAIPDLERRKISGSFKQQVTGAMDRMPGFVRVELEKNSAGQYKKKRRVVNGKNKPIHIAWDLLATLQAYDAADNPLGEPVECLASDVPANAAGSEPYGAYPTRVDANDNLVADRKFDAGFFQKGLLPAGAAYVRVDYPYDVPITSASTLSVSN